MGSLFPKTILVIDTNAEACSAEITKTNSRGRPLMRTRR